ncbi:Crp/Fnr family transcriptional regulator [Clostridiaceae bacterium M8S5]|nr:Crp/Fnr family transcriptional regulator [Clostridiaceae bacterium M8S5]
MDLLFKKLKKVELFSDYNEDQIKRILNTIKYKVNKYNDKDIIALQGDRVKGIGVILKGEVYVNKIYEDGRQLQVKKMVFGELIGHALVFADTNFYTSTLISHGDSEVMFVPNEGIADMCMNNRSIFNNLVRILSNQVVYLSNRLKLSSLGTIRKKLISYLINEYEKQNSQVLEIPISRKKMAEFFGVTRPALSNEMIKMKKDGLIDYKDNIIEIINISKLKNEI